MSLNIGGKKSCKSFWIFSYARTVSAADKDRKLTTFDIVLTHLEDRFITKRHLLIFLEKSLNSWIMNNAFSAWWIPSFSLKTAVTSLYKNCRLFFVVKNRTMMAWIKNENCSMISSCWNRRQIYDVKSKTFPRDIFILLICFAVY